MKKRILSFVLAAIMACSVAVIPTGAVYHSATGENTLSEKNVGIKVPYFSGTAKFNELTGKASSAEYTYDEGEEEVISTKTPTAATELIIDGQVSEEEWGTPILNITSDYAAQMGTTEVSAENTYYYHEKDGVNQLNLAAGLNLKAWMAWDEDFFYLAAEVIDPDSILQGGGGADIWDGDALQFRIDPDGPNAISGNTTYDPSVNKYPWGSTTRPAAAGAEVCAGKVGNFGVAYVEPNLASGHTDIYDMANRYEPYREAARIATGEIDYWSTRWKQCGMSAMDDEAENPFGAAYATVTSKRTTNIINKKEYRTVYEVAIPWTFMNGSYFEYNAIEAPETSQEQGEEGKEITEGVWETIAHMEEYTPTAGDEFGMALVLFNGGKTGTSFNSWLTWGTCICNSQVLGLDFPTAGGSNSMLLVSDELGTTNCAHEFNDPTCVSPYTCKLCGYQKGFKTGHTYVSTIKAIPTETEDGAIEAVCSVCKDTHVATIAACAKEAYKEFDSSIPYSQYTGATLANIEWCSAGYNYVYHDEETDEYIWDEATGKAKTAFSDVEGKTVVDLSITEDTLNPGSYFETETAKGTYTTGYQFKLTGNLVTLSSESYIPGFYHQFGGKTVYGTSYSYGLGFNAGFLPNVVGGTVGKFVIVKGGLQIENEVPKYTVLAESAEIDLGTDWHQFVFTYDEENACAIMYCDGEVMAAAWHPEMGMDGNTQRSITRRMDMSCYFTDMKFTSASYYNEKQLTSGYTVTCDGVVIGTYNAGETVNLPVPAFKVPSKGKYNRFFTWLGAPTGTEVVRSRINTKAGTANNRTYSMVMPAQDVVLTSDFVLLCDVDGNKRLAAADILATRKHLAGVSGGKITDQKKLEAIDINLDGRQNANDVANIKSTLASKYTPTK